MPLGRQARVVQWLVGSRHSCRCRSGQTAAISSRHRVAEHCPAAADKQAAHDPPQQASRCSLGTAGMGSWGCSAPGMRGTALQDAKVAIVCNSVHVGAAGGWVSALCTALLRRNRGEASIAVVQKAQMSNQ